MWRAFFLNMDKWLEPLWSRFWDPGTLATPLIRLLQQVSTKMSQKLQRISTYYVKAEHWISVAEWLRPFPRKGMPRLQTLVRSRFVLSMGSKAVCSSFCMLPVDLVYDFMYYVCVNRLWKNFSWMKLKSIFAIFCSITTKFMHYHQPPSNKHSLWCLLHSAIIITHVELTHKQETFLVM